MHKRHAMLNTELARPIGIVNGTSVGGTRPMRVRSKGSAVISYKPDASGALVPRLFKTPRTSTPKPMIDDTVATKRLEVVANENVKRTPEEVAALIGIPAPKHDPKFDHDYTQ